MNAKQMEVCNRHVFIGVSKLLGVTAAVTREGDSPDDSGLWGLRLFEHYIGRTCEFQSPEDLRRKVAAILRDIADRLEPRS